MSTEGPALESHEGVYNEQNIAMNEAQSYAEPPPGFASAEDLNGDHVMTLADAEEIVNANPELYHLDYEQTQQEYAGGSGLEQGYPNQQNYDMGAEALNPTTPGYFGFDQGPEFYTSYSPLPQVGFSYEDQGVYDGGAVQTPFHPDTARTPFMAQTPFNAQTPYIPPNTYISETPYIPQAQFVEAGPSGTYGAADDIMADANSFFSSTGDVSFEDPAETADAENDSQAPEQPVPEKKPARKRASHAKAKQPAKNDDNDGDAIADAKPNRKRVTRATKRKLTEEKDDTDDDAGAGAEADAKPPTTRGGRKTSGTVTPAKRTRATPTSEKNSRGGTRTRKTPKNGTTQGMTIPDKYEECTDADKALLDMRDAGRPWKEIRSTYESLGGPKYGGSTLPNRYDRMKDKFVTMREEDHIRLFDAKKAIEADFESKKWAMIAADIVANGGDTYTTDVLQRRFRSLMHKEGFVVDEGLAAKDGDFVVGNGGGDVQNDDQREEEMEDDE